MPLLKKNNLPKILSFPRKIYNTNQLQQINLQIIYMIFVLYLMVHYYLLKN